MIARRPDSVRKLPTAIGGIRIGEVLDDLPVQDLSGKKARLHFGDAKGMLVYVLSPSCIWCKRNYRNIVALSKTVAAQYRVVGISANGTLDQLNSHLASFPLPFEVVRADTESTGVSILSGTPTTLIVAADGRITKAWVGAYADSNAPDIEAFFRIRLPGLEASALASPRLPTP
jgi:hypothetical protein